MFVSKGTIFSLIRTFKCQWRHRAPKLNVPRDCIHLSSRTMVPHKHTAPVCNSLKFYEFQCGLIARTQHDAHK